MKDAVSFVRIGAAGCALLRAAALLDVRLPSREAVDWQAAVRRIAALSAIQRNSLRPIWPGCISGPRPNACCRVGPACLGNRPAPPSGAGRSEEHTSELQSHVNLVCRLLL